MRKRATATIWISFDSRTNRVFQILREAGAELKVSIQGALMLAAEHVQAGNCREDLQLRTYK